MKKTFEELLDDYEDAIRNTELERSGPDRDYYRAARADEAVPRKALIEYVEQLEKERDDIEQEIIELTNGESV